MPVALTEEMKNAINNSLPDGAPIVGASVSADGQPVLGFRGTAQAYSDDQLAIWVRNPEGGILRNIAANPKVALMYRNPQTRLSFQVHGRARQVDDEAFRTHVYDHSPEVERNFDQERKGKAVLIDIDRVIQRGEVIMSRDDSGEAPPSD